MDRREFLTQTMGLGVAAVAAQSAGAVENPLKLGGSTPTEGAPMQGFRVAPMDKVRVGFVGVGTRGASSVRRVAMIPGCEVTAVCDFFQDRVDASVDWLVKNGYPKPAGYSGEEGWKALCESDKVDVVYCISSWYLHAPLGLYAMKCGKHYLTDVPGVQTVEDGWAMVEAAEKYRRHCMMLENCCYGEEELLALNLTAKGLLGDLVRASCGYIHDQREINFGPRYRVKPGEKLAWPIQWKKDHPGNQYPTHGLGPVCKCLNINRGDAFDYLVSMESAEVNNSRYLKLKKPDHPARNVKWDFGDVNLSLIRTVKGRLIFLEYDISSTRPYSRINFVNGTRGAFRSFPDLRIALAAGEGEFAHSWFDEKRTAEIRRQHMHPLWKSLGGLGQKVGGHGGMDFVMDLRWAYCLQNGLPLDTDVYDLASWSALEEITERSVRSGSQPQKIPDFTRGGWKTGKPFEIVDCDLAKFHGRFGKVQEDDNAKKTMKAEGFSG